MKHDATLRILGDFCAVHKYHYPKPMRTVKHHIHPQEYGGKTVPENLVLVCDTGHYNIHTALDAMLAGVNGPKVSRSERKIAQQGYDSIKETGVSS